MLNLMKIQELESKPACEDYKSELNVCLNEAHLSVTGDVFSPRGSSG